MCSYLLEAAVQLAARFRTELEEGCRCCAVLMLQNLILIGQLPARRESTPRAGDVTPQWIALMGSGRQCTHPPLPVGNVSGCLDSMLGERR